MIPESLREYTAKYVSKGVVVKTASGLYGDNIVYDGDTPVYTAEEPYAFYLFNRWDKSGFLNNGIDETLVHPNFVLAMKCFIDMLANEGISKIKVPLIQVLNYGFDKNNATDQVFRSMYP